MGPVMGSRRHGNKYSGSIKDGEFLDQLNDYQLPKNNSASWIYLKDNKTKQPFYKYSNIRDNINCAIHFIEWV
jgi:hypothetical protein